MQEIILKRISVPAIKNPNPFSDLWEKKLIIEKGRNYQIAAASGQGKTTFLSLLFGLRFDYSGEILFDNQNIRTLQLNHWIDKRRNHLALMFQDLRLFTHISARENILLKLEQTNFMSLNRMKTMAKKLSVHSILDKKVNQLSRGESQRIALIRSLAQSFDFLLLDEPFSHLDPESKASALELILDWVSKKKKSVLITSHDKELLSEGFQLLQV